MDFGGVALMAEDLFIAAWNLVESSGAYRDFFDLHSFISFREKNESIFMTKQHA